MILRKLFVYFFLLIIAGAIHPNITLALYTNLALSGQASQSSTGTYDGITGYATRANDGNTDGTWGHYSVSHTNHNTNAWWRVELNGVFEIDHVIIWNRNDSNRMSERLTNFTVSVLNSSMTTVFSKDFFTDGGTFYSDLRIELPEGILGKYVQVQLNGTNYLHLAEVEVYGVRTDLSPIIGDFDGDGDIDSSDLSSFSKIYGKTDLSYNLINLSNTPLLDQAVYEFLDRDGDIGPGGCVPTSFAMIFIHYFNITNPYDVVINISPTSANTVNIVNTIANHLDAYVENNSTWVKDINIIERMKEYTVAFDTDSEPERVFVEWDIDYYFYNEKSNDQWLEIFKQKLAAGEPILFSGYAVLPNVSGGHASVITGYKNIYGAEYVKIHDTWSHNAHWWRVVKNTSLTIDTNSETGLLCFVKDNGEYLFYLNGLISMPTQMLTTPSY